MSQDDWNDGFIVGVTATLTTAGGVNYFINNTYGETVNLTQTRIATPTETVSVTLEAI